MTQRKAIVIVNGQLQELPTGDTLVGADPMEIITSANINSALGYTPADAATVAGIETLLAAL